MANDVIGAPEIVVVKGRVFHFSPLNDLEYSTLDSWVAWRTKESNESEEDCLASVAAAVQILHLSIKRTEQWSVEACHDFVANDEITANEIIDAYVVLNADESDVADTTSTKTNDKVVSDNYKDKVYLHLAEVYHWTFEQIALMTPKQQRIAINQNKPLKFASEAEYYAWQRSRKQR